MMTLSNWNTLQEAADWLTRHTGDEWSEKAVLARYAKSLPETIIIALPRGSSLLHLNQNSEWQECGPFNYSSLFEVSGVERFIHELEIAGESIPLGLVSQEGAYRYKCLNPLSLNDVRLTPSQIQDLPTAFHRFREDLYCRYGSKVNDALEVLAQEIYELDGKDFSEGESNHTHKSESQSTIHRIADDDDEGKRNVANLFVENIIGERKKNNLKATLAPVWLELDSLVGDSIIYARTERGFLCNIGEATPHLLTKGAVRGVIDRSNRRNKTKQKKYLAKNNHA